MRLVMVVLWLVLGAGIARGESAMVMDGDFRDWAEIPLAATDPAGDGTGAFDLTRVQVTSRGTMLYVRFDIGRTLNLQSGSDEDGSLRLEVLLGEGVVLTVDFRERSFLLNGRIQEGLGWRSLRFESGPTYASEEFEVRLDLGSLGVGMGETVRVDFSGSDSLPSSVTHTLDALPAERRGVVLERHPEADVRVVSMNTLRGGLFNAERFEELGRLVAGTDGDIYAFQEEWESSEQQFPGLMRRIMDGEGGRWNAYKRDGNVIVTHLEMEPIPTGDGRYAAAAIDLGKGRVVILVCVHFKCCGSIGSSEDERRIGEVLALLNDLDRVRSGDISLEMDGAQDAPVIVIGDYNLVGSRMPLDLLLRAGLSTEAVHVTGDHSVATWRSNRQDAGSFGPGRLDLVTYSSDLLNLLRCYALETTLLTEGELDSMGVEADDSSSSDHRVLVVDFGVEGGEEE